MDNKGKNNNTRLGDTLKSKADAVNSELAAKTADAVWEKIVKLMNEKAAAGVYSCYLPYDKFGELYERKLYTAEMLTIISERARLENIIFKEQEVSYSEHQYCVDWGGKRGN